MTTQERDLIVLGSGPGGYVAAIRAAQLGRTVTIVEKEALGGVCLNWGCIPSKALLKSAQLYYDMRHHAQDFGFGIKDIHIDFPRIIDRSREVAGKLSKGVSGLMRKGKIEVVMGTGELDKGQILHVTDGQGKRTSYHFKDVIIATGARARNIPGVEIDGEVIHTYRTALEHRTQPKKVLVIGAGAIGMEFAYFYHALGAQVTVAEALPQILPLEDAEISESLRKIMVKRGMTIKTAAKVSNIKRSGKAATATITTEEGAEQWSGDLCMVAIGVVPNTENIGLEKVGIEKNERGFIKVNQYLETNVPHHYAMGDVSGNQLLAHKASHEGLVCAENVAGKSRHAMHYDNVPSCTYCQPQVASIGITEKTAKEKGLKYKLGKIPFSAIGKAIAIGEPDGMIKVIIDEDTGEVLGVHILHSEATELIAEAVAIRSHEGIAATVMETIHPHPTLSESMGEAIALALGRPVNF